MARWSISPFVLAIPLAGSLVACGGGSNEGDKSGSQTASTSQWPAGYADPCKTPITSGFLGDNLCIDPPPPQVGYQLHFGPSDYTNAADLKNYTLDPGAEAVECEYMHSPNTKPEYYSEYHSRMRSGTHHMILWTTTPTTAATANPPADGTLVSSCRDFTHYTFALGAQAGLGTAGGVLDAVPGDAKENEGLAYLQDANTSVVMETHYINTSQKPILREVWLNIIYIDPSQVTTKIDSMFFIGGVAMNIPAGSQKLVTAGPATQPTPPSGQQNRIIGISAHTHASTTRETVYVNHSDGTKDAIYESYNWQEPLVAYFDSAHTNPTSTMPGTDTAFTGDLVLQSGDTVSWECDINNQTTASLQFGDLAYTGEMCNVFGFYVPGSGGTWNTFTP